MIGYSSDRKSVFHVGLHSRYREVMTQTRFNGFTPRWIIPCLGLGLTIFAPACFAQSAANPVAAVPAATQSSLSASAIYAGIEEWGKLRSALSRLQGVSVSISAISIDGALILFRYEGTPADLQAILARAGLELKLDSAGGVVKVAASQL
jgi:hypothetical protein